MDVSPCTWLLCRLVLIPYSRLYLPAFHCPPTPLPHLFCYDHCLFWDHIVKEDFGEKELILWTQGLRIYFKFPLVLPVLVFLYSSSAIP